MKPMPYPIVGKVHDCLTKIIGFMKTNAEELKVALVWKGGDHLEIYQRVGLNRHSAMTNSMRDRLIAQCPGRTAQLPVINE